ncbi:MAG: DUF3021 domain-containing protein [Erysipelotrichaceae bacterium]|nr:DUF3021 domain-containing protein [Erysipelotrichaceae bacterium]
MIKRTIKRALIGFIIGMAVGDIIAYFEASLSGSTTFVSSKMIERFGSEAMAIFVQTLLSGIHGAICMAGVSFYEIEDWSLLKTSIIHYLLIICSFTTIGLFLNWVPDSLPGLLIVWACMGIVYMIIWLIMHFRYKAEVRKLNEMLEKEENK